MKLFDQIEEMIGDSISHPSSDSDIEALILFQQLRERINSNLKEAERQERMYKRLFAKDMERTDYRDMGLCMEGKSLGLWEVLEMEIQDYN